MPLACAEGYFVSVLRQSGIDCGDQIPDDLFVRSSFIRVLKTGGVELRPTRQAENATVTLDVYAAGDRSDAYALGDKAIELINDSVGTEIDGVSIGWPRVSGGNEIRNSGQPADMYRFYYLLNVVIHTHPV